MPEFNVATFYRFAPLPDYRQLRQPLLELCRARDVHGTVLLAAEGINGTIAGTPDGVRAVLGWLRRDPRLSDMPHKMSSAASLPFRRLKVRLKREIVSLGVPEADPTSAVGRYVPPDEWNALLQDPEVLVIDTRNQYEVAIGSFQNAHDPQLERFRDFPDYVHRHLDPQRHRRVAMFCTGGIRCERASSFMLQQGYEEVYQLQGGILKYLEEVPAEASLWQGDCFVFDERVAVSHGLAPGRHELCRGCRHPISAADKQRPEYQPGISCPHCYHRRSEAHYRRAAERWRQVRLARNQGRSHLRQPDDGRD